MKLFDIFKPRKKIIIIENIGEFKREDGIFGISFEGVLFPNNLGKSITITFPEKDNEISGYQKKYYHNLNRTWNKVREQIDIKLENRASNFKVTSILIPDSNDDRFDIDSEIVIENGRDIFSAIIINNQVEELIQIQ